MSQEQSETVREILDRRYQAALDLASQYKAERDEWKTKAILHGNAALELEEDLKCIAKMRDIHAARVAELEGALGKLADYSGQQICPHEETHRGGANWEICDCCGAKWADYRGGKPEFKYPRELEVAWELLGEKEASHG